MQVPVHNISGEVVGQVELRDDIFAVPVNRSVMHQALVRQLANARLGTVKTKTRAEVSGSGALSSWPRTSASASPTSGPEATHSA